MNLFNFLTFLLFHLNYLIHWCYCFYCLHSFHSLHSLHFLQHPAQFPLFFFAEDAFARYDFKSGKYAIPRQDDLLKLLSGSDDNFFTEIPVSVTALENLTLSEDGTYRRTDPEKEAYAEIRIDPEPGKSMYLFLVLAPCTRTTG